MPNYKSLKTRMDNGEVIILDGAIGTELQTMGAPMDPASWCGPANYTHYATVRLMHQRYIKAGADILTTNTFNTIRPALEASGYTDKVREINTRAVDAALEAIDRADVDRDLYVAGSISCRMPVRDSRTGTLQGGTGYGYGASLSAQELKAYCDEQADVLAESGVDFFLIENMWADNESRCIATEAAKSTGLPVWVAFTASMAPDNQTVRMDFGGARNSYSGGMGMPLWTSDWRSVNHEMTLAEGVAEVARLEPDVLGVFHARIAATTEALRVVQAQWAGPVVSYPDSGREDFIETWRDMSLSNEESPEDLTHESAKWVDMGVQVIGGCCGFGADYIEPLRGGLPERIPTA